MKKNVFSLSLIILFTIVFSFSFREASAQGTFKCRMTPPAQGFICQLDINNCEPGYKPTACEKFNGFANRSICETTHECIPENCTKKIGLVGEKCPAGYPIDCQRNLLCCKEQNDCAPSSPPPAAGGEEGIDFEKLSGAIPSLKPIFQAGPASNLGGIISTILPYLFVFAGLLLLFYLIYGGFHMMIAAGNEKGLAEAKGKITNALIGFLLLFISYWLVQIVEYVLGIQIF